ncbi:hypothetical protein [Novosphingobium gossypii]
MGSSGIAKVYLREKLQILATMTEGDPNLDDRTMALIEHAETSIGLRP